ncbi:MAG: LysE family transporter [Proteobacteria bacterium]|nr:LysE family transporter [Pseudomonadota bacterium]
MAATSTPWKAALPGEPAGLLRNGDMEGLPTVKLKTSAAGVPCVGTGVGGIADFVEYDANGRLVQSGDSALEYDWPVIAQRFNMFYEISNGWRKTAFAAFGNIVGLFFLGIFAIAGLGAILKSSVVVYSVIKISGAMFLIYWGLKLLFNRNGKVEILTS